MLRLCCDTKTISLAGAHASTSAMTCGLMGASLIAAGQCRRTQIQLADPRNDALTATPASASDSKPAPQHSMVCIDQLQIAVSNCKLLMGAYADSLGFQAQVTRQFVICSEGGMSRTVLVL